VNDGVGWDFSVPYPDQLGTQAAGRVQARTKSEARAKIKKSLALKSLPPGTKVERVA
jgi:hypothetical protein